MKNKKKRMVARAARTATSLTAVAKDVMSYTLEGLIHVFGTMFAAVFLSHPDEVKRLLNTYPDEPMIRLIVNEAIRYHDNPADIAELTSRGFFDYELHRLLKIAKNNHIAGARLAPIFYSALNHADELKLSDKLQNKIKAHMACQLKSDGFLIQHVDMNNLVLRFAEDVIPA